MDLDFSPIHHKEIMKIGYGHHPILISIQANTYKCCLQHASTKRRRKNTNTDHFRRLLSDIRIVRTLKFLLFNPVFIFLILILYSFVPLTEACLGRPTPQRRPEIIEQTPAPSSLSPTFRPNITFHTYACPPIYASWYCLNGATCFTVKIGEHTLYNCECADGYMGTRCEFKDLDSSYILSKKQILLESASIAFGATLAILLVVLVCASLYIRYNQNKTQKHLFAAAISCVDGPIKRKPFSRRIPTTHLPLMRTQSEQLPRYSSLYNNGV